MRPPPNNETELTKRTAAGALQLISVLDGRNAAEVTELTELEISTDRSRLDVDLVHTFLSRSSYWAQGRSRAIVERSIANSLCVGAYQGATQVGFGRLITDYAVVGYVADMFVVPEHRGRGIGKAILKALLEQPGIAELQVVLLRSKDARSLYSRFGFTNIQRPEEMMARYRSGVQQRDEPDETRDLVGR